MYNPNENPRNWFILFKEQYMSARHGYNTTGGIEYDDRGKYREDKKVRKSHIHAANQQAMEMPINQYQHEE